MRENARQDDWREQAKKRIDYNLGRVRETEGILRQARPILEQLLAKRLRKTVYGSASPTPTAKEPHPFLLRPI